MHCQAYFAIINMKIISIEHSAELLPISVRLNEN